MLSSIDHLHRKLQKRWVPKWYNAFCDNKYGGFHERLGHSFKPVDMEYKRLVTQCRQLAVYAHSNGLMHSDPYKADLADRLNFLVSSYQDTHNGGWRFAVHNDGSPKDNMLDLYGHSFVIFTMCHIHLGLKDPRAEGLALQTLKLIKEHFKIAGALGYTEALDPTLKPIRKIRRQDPHMHLLEACLFAYETLQDPAYMETADEMIQLFLSHFIRERDESIDLIEFFDEDLTPHKAQGHRVKPGHYFEWVWLLQKYVAQKDFNETDPIKVRLLELAGQLLIKGNKQGVDKKFGGIYDFTDHDGKVLEETKRLWPFAEALKANALMLDVWHDRDQLKDRMAEMVEVFESGYIDKRGFWTETLNRDLSPATDYMPGTTPYHLYFGIVETLDYLKSRGRSKSLKSGPLGIIYNARRHLSNLVQSVVKRAS